MRFWELNGRLRTRPKTKKGRKRTHPKTETDANGHAQSGQNVIAHNTPRALTTSAICREALGTSSRPQWWWCLHGVKELEPMVLPQRTPSQSVEQHGHQDSCPCQPTPGQKSSTHPTHHSNRAPTSNKLFETWSHITKLGEKSHFCRSSIHDTTITCICSCSPTLLILFRWLTLLSKRKYVSTVASKSSSESSEHVSISTGVPLDVDDAVDSDELEPNDEDGQNEDSPSVVEPPLSLDSPAADSSKRRCVAIDHSCTAL